MKSNAAAPSNRRPAQRSCAVVSDKRARSALLGTTAIVRVSIAIAAALPGITLLMALTASAALADGGAGSSTIPGHGGTAGLDSVAGTGGSGGLAPSSWIGGGGGGGSGAIGGGGGNGDGDPGGGGVGGAGGATAGTAGAPGGNGSLGHSAGGGGGGGGAHGYLGATLPVAAATGGHGGAGGNGSSSLPGIFNLGGGGGGGAGGYGAVITGGGGGTFLSTVTGGNGGTGGIGDVQGSGGSGGIGLYYAGGGGASFTNTSAIGGGNGGAGSTPGAGGNGIYVDAGSSAATIINAGAISGGLSGDGVTRANAITFAGGTNILELQAGSTITGNVVAFSAADTLRLGGSADASFDASQIGTAAQYRNFGVFEKTGASIWTLSGSNNASMPWAVNAGTLAVNAAIANASMTVNSGGTLGGTGTVGAVTVASGGTLAPGNSIGTITVSGNLTFAAGSIYAVELSPSAADRTNVTGSATLSGATVQAIFAGGSYVERQYTIVNATSNIVGTFTALTMSNLPAGFKSSLGYDVHNAYLNLVLDLTPTPSPTPLPINSGLNGNQTNVANAASGYFSRGGAIPVVFGALTPAGLSMVAGEAATATQQASFDAMDLFMGLLTDPFSAGRRQELPGSAASYADQRAGHGALRDAYAMMTKAPAHAPFGQRWNVWAAGFGGSQTTDGNAIVGSTTVTSRIYGTAVGADYWLSPQTVAGFALAGGGTHFSLSQGLGSGSSDLFQAGAFVRHSAGAAYLTAAAAYGWQDVTTDRTVDIAGLNQLRAHFNANTFSGRLEVGNRIAASLFGGIGLTPYAATQVTALQLPNYAEQVLAGGNAFALSYDGKVVSAPRSELGFRSDKSFVLTDAVLTLRARAAWAHNFNSERSAIATFQALPGASFLVNGAAQAPDAALVTASAETRWLNGWSAAGTFEGEFSNVTMSYAGKGVVRYAWYADATAR